MPQAHCKLISFTCKLIGMNPIKRIKAFVFRQHHFSVRKINELRDIVRRQPLVMEQHSAAREARNSQGGGARRAVIYTVAIKGYDVPTLHSYIAPQWDYICFTNDEALLSLGCYGVWRLRPLARVEASDALTNRWHKLHPHILFPQYERSIYIDSKVDARTAFLFEEIEKRKESRLLIPIHAECSCIYKEIRRCLKAGKETKENAAKVRRLLKDAGFPKSYGLTENSIVYRRHNDEAVIGLMSEWWGILSSVSHRDQLSLSFLLWKRGIAVSSVALPNARSDAQNFHFYRELVCCAPQPPIHED